MKTKTVVPCGMLYSNERRYFLLKPYPIPGDSWEGDNVYRFLVTPATALGMNCFSFARHVVTNNFTAEYAPDMPKINIQVHEDLDVDNIPSITDIMENDQ
jgi:hypothetical protein